MVLSPLPPPLSARCARQESLAAVPEAWQRAAVSQERTARAADIEARRSTLTPREVEVLELLVETYPIAAKLGTSIRTVEHHRAHIFKKMGARSLSHLIKLVLEIRRPGPHQ
jgi:FixJ family two-component response regulator